MKVFQVISLLLYPQWSWTVLAPEFEFRFPFETTSTSTSARSDKTENAVDFIIRLFSSHQIHCSALIVYGKNNSISKTRNILRHPSYSKLIISTVVEALERSENQRIENTGTNKVTNFAHVLDSCVQTFYTEQKIFILIHVDGLEQVKEILTDISLFYEKYPSKSLTLYFIIFWQNTDNAEIEIANGKVPKKILDHVKSFLRTAPMNSHLYALFQTTRRNNSSEETDSWVMWELYKVYGEHVFRPVSVSGNSLKQLVRRRNDFKGASIKALVQESAISPFFSSFNEIDGKLVFNGGISYSFLQPMSEVLNFNIEIVNGTGWIAEDSNGGLIGMGKQLLDNVADIVLSLSEIIPFRIQHLASSHTITEFKVNAFFRQPPPGLYRDIYVEAFSPQLWGVVLLTWLVIIFCLIVFTSIKKKYDSLDSFEEGDKMMVADAIGWAVAAACQTGWHQTPKSTSIQIIFLCGLVAGLVYYTAYSSSIISIFSYEQNHFHTLDDLLQQGFILYGSTGSLSGRYNVENRAMKDGVTKESRLIEVAPALKKIQESRIAYVISYEFFLDKAIERYSSYPETCKILSQLPGYIDVQYNAWYFRKFDPLKKFLDWQLTRWKEPGLVHRINSLHVSNLPARCDQKKRETVPLDIQDVKSAFVILFVGFVASAVVLVLEIMSIGILETRKRSLRAEEICWCICHRKKQRSSNINHGKKVKT